MLQRKLILFIFMLFNIILLNACGKCDNLINDGDKLNLALSAPSEYPAGIATTMPVVVTNTNPYLLSNIVYSISGSNAGSDILITPTSASNCATLAAGQECTLSVNIPATSTPGSFTIVASASKSSSILNKLLSSVSLTNNASVSVTPGLTELPLNTESGINGLTSYYNNAVSLPNNTTGITVVTFVVTSANAGVFNTIDLTDSNGNSLTYQNLTGNSESGMTALNQGAIVSLAVAIPNGTTQLSYYPTLKMNGVVIPNGDSVAPVTITILRPTTPIQGNLSITPSNFTLNESYFNQTITVINNGTGTANSITQNISTPMTIDTINTTCGTSLKANASCVYVINFAASTSDKAGTGTFVINYQTGIGAASATSTFNYRGKLAIASLNISSGSNPNFDFNSTTANPATNSIVTIINTGITTIESFNYTLPANFTTSIDNVSNSCGANLILQPNTSCNIKLIYSNAAITNRTTSNITVNYKYPDPETKFISNGSSTIGVTYSTAQSQATLSISPSSFSFGNIANNNYESNVQTFTISNTGEIATANVPIATIATSDNIYKITNNTCTSSLNAGATCNISVSAGPITSNIFTGLKSNALNMTYQPYQSASNNTSSANLTTQVTASQSAVINITQTQHTGFAGGNGTTTPYELESGVSGSITYTITNSGSVPANNFAESYSSGALSPWTMSGSCPVTLAAGNSCSITFTAIGNGNNLNLPVNTINLIWKDQASPSGTSKVFATNQVYVNVFLPANITFSAESISLTPNESTTIIATLNNGYNESNQTITFANNTSGAVSSITSNPSPCTLSSSVTSCTFTIIASSNAVSGNYSIGVTGGSIALPIQTIPVAIVLKWIYLGKAGFSDGVSSYISLAFNPLTNEPYVAYQDARSSNAVSVMKFNGNSWVGIGYTGFSGRTSNYVSLAFNQSGQPYVAYQDALNSHGASVMMFNGNSWSYVGPSNFSLGIVNYTSLAFNESINQPYVAYQDESNNNKATVMAYDGSNWNVVGESGFSAGIATYTSLAFNESTNQPYVAYKDESNNGKATVMAYDGTKWVVVGESGFSANAIDSMSLAFNPVTNQPYVAYQDAANNDRATVMAYDGTNWNLVGTADFSADIAEALSLAFNANGQPYVAYADIANNQKATVMTFSGGSWINFGNPDFSAGISHYTSLAFNPITNKPYVAYEDNINGNKVSVMYYPF